MPQYANTIASYFNISIWSGNVFNESELATRHMTPPKGSYSWSDLGKRNGLKTIKSPEIVFRPLDDTATNTYRERYAGSQKERKEKEMEIMKAAEDKVINTQSISPDALFNEKIALKTAKIVKIERHPDAEKLYIETLDDGSGTERIIVSGLVPYLKEEELLGKSIIIADNLKPRKMRGIESKGMLLAGDYKDAEGKECVEVLDSSWAKPGTPAILEGSDISVKKPDSIDADTFFAAPMKIIDHYVTVNGKKLLIDGQPVKTIHVESGDVS